MLTFITVNILLVVIHPIARTISSITARTMVYTIEIVTDQSRKQKNNNLLPVSNCICSCLLSEILTLKNLKGGERYRLF